MRAQRGVDLTLVVTGVGAREADKICRIDPDMILPSDTLAGALAEAHRSGARTVPIDETSYLDDRLTSARGCAARRSVR